MLKARAHLVEQQRSRQNVIRGLLGTLGIRFPRGAGKFVGHVSSQTSSNFINRSPCNRSVRLISDPSVWSRSKTGQIKCYLRRTYPVLATKRSTRA